MHTLHPIGSCRILFVGGPRPLSLRPLGVFLGVLLNVLALLSVGVRPTRAATFQVTTLADSASPVPAGSLRAAITSANANLSAGSTVTFKAGLSGMISLASALPTLNKNITIQGPSASALIVDGGGVCRPFVINAMVTASLSGLTIQNGDIRFGNGSGIDNLGTLTLTGCTLAGNNAENGSGGGVANDGTGALTLTDCTLTQNSANNGGGGVSNKHNGMLTLTGCTLTQNTTSGAGGGVYNNGTLTLTGCTLTQNSASSGKGGGVANSDTATLTSCTFAGNSTSGAGGGVYNDTYTTLILTGCTLTGNSAEYGGGGGVYNDTYSTLTLTDDILYGDSNGEVGGSVTVSHCDIQQSGFAGSSGNLDADPLFATPFVRDGPPSNLHLKAGSPCIHVGNPQLAGTPDHDGIPYATPNPSIGAYEYGNLYTVTNTEDSGDGSLRGAILAANGNFGSTITFKSGLSGTILLGSGLPALTANMTITGPGASVLAVDGQHAAQPFFVNSGVTASLSGLTIQKGNAGNVGNGGGVYNDSGGTLTLTGCTLTQNSASSSGGGVCNNGTLTLTGCTLAGNSAAIYGGGVYSGGTATLTGCTLAGNGGGNGGGVFNDYYNTLALTGCTLTGNSAGYGGGVSNSGVVTLTDDILYGDSAQYDDVELYGPIMASHCDIQQAGFAGSSGNLNADPRLSALGSYGGPTQTFALLPGSPCLGAGVAVSGHAADQRGVAVPQNGRYDIGAFESRGFTVKATQGSGQSAPVGTAFAQGLKATVTANAGSEPVAGGLVTFTGPSSGASATFSPDPAPISSGVAGATATANGIPGGPFPVTADTGAGSATYSLTNTATAPAITTQPQTQTVTAGQTATFTAAASGSPAPTVQWQVSTDGGILFINITDATSTTYTFTATAGQSGGEYRAVFTNSAGVIATSAATLTVNAALAVTANPSSVTVTAGTTAMFSAAAIGSPAPTVQWQVSTDGGILFINITDATSTTYTFTATAGQSGGEYRAVFTNSAGVIATSAATLTVNPGAAAQFSAAAPAAATAGTPVPVSFLALDAFGNLATGYNGTVQFTSTDPQAGFTPTSVAFSGGVGSVSVTFNTAGVQTVTGTDTTASALTGTTGTITVSKAATTTTLTSSLNPSAFGQSVTFTATVTGSSPTSTVTFTVDGVDGAPVALTGGMASFTTSALAGGPHTLTATYSGDAGNAGSTSGPLTQTVSAAAVDVTGSVTVTQGGFTRLPRTTTLVQKVTLTNTGSSTITGPLSLVLDGLTAGVTLANATGTTTGASGGAVGSPYLSVAGDLAAGASVSVSLRFSDPSLALILYTPRVLAGTGGR